MNIVLHLFTHSMDRGLQMTSKASSVALAALLSSVALLTLSACDGGSAAKPARDQTAANAPAGGSSGGSSSANSYSSGNARSDGGYASSSDGVDHRKDPVAQVDGVPMWANSKKYAADESAEYHFKRDGADFDAKTEADYVQKAHAFVAHPPKDALTLTRSNGDKLIYDPKKNVFAVATKDGAPRTMFKPDSGQTYWDQQVARQQDDAKGGDDSNGGERRYTRRTHHSDDESDG
jgi:pyocin large subunit-like protein